MSEKPTTVAPKFGSFRPKATQPPALPSKNTSQETDLRSGDDTDRRKHSRQENDERRHRRDHDERLRQRHSPSREGTSRERRIPEGTLTREELQESKLFIVDRRGDAKNVEYGSLHRYSIPQYYRKGYGRLIGAPGNAKIDREASTEKLIVLQSASVSVQDRWTRLLGNKAGQCLHERRLRLQKQPAAQADDRDADFLPLRSNTGTKRKRDDPSHSTVPLIPEGDYRSIEGKTRPGQESLDHNLEDVSESDEDKVEDLFAKEARKQSAALTRRTKEEPSDARSWIALVEHQLHVLTPGKDPSTLTGSEKRALADVRLSIYEKALRSVKREDPDYERLILGMMEEGSLLWETAKLATKWQDILKEHPSSIELWTRYLDVLQTSASTFRLEECKVVYLKCLQQLERHEKSRSGADKHGMDRARSKVVLRYTHLLRDAGYEEQAYSIWQAILELHFFRPKNLYDSDEAMQSFADFWDSDVPRIGEEGACGWSAHHSGEAACGIRTSAPLRIPKLDAARPFASFAAAELDSLGRLHLSPCADHGVIDDPFRFVMYSDLEQVLKSADGLPKLEVVDNFLAFMGLPPLAGDEITTLQPDQFLEQGGPVKFTGETSIVPIQRQISTTWHLFNGAFKLWTNNSREKELVTFLDQILSRLTASCPNWDTMAEYTVAFRLAIDSPGVAKYTKQLLKTRPTSLRLYNAYALVQASRAGVDKAAEIWSTALKMSSGFDDVELANVVLLWHNWMLTLIYRERDEEKALGLILAMVNGDPQVAKQALNRTEISPGHLLKAKQYFEGSFETMVYQQKYDLAGLYAKTHMWLVYFINDRSLQPATEQCGKYSSQLARHSSTRAKELLAQAIAEIIAYHIKARQSFKPAVLRTELGTDLELFPCNSRVVEAFMLVSSHTKIEDRIRSSLHLELLTGPHANVVGWSFALAEDLRRFRSDVGSGTENAVRASFKRALVGSDSKVKHSIILWKEWLGFEVSLLSQRPDAQRAKSLNQVRLVFLDGLRSLPWTKAWVIWGLNVFAQQGGMSNVELKRVFDVLGERELRMRVAAEEMEEAVANLKDA